MLATPYAKKLAKEKGYDLSQIPGTGPNGTVVAKDVENFVAGPRPAPWLPSWLPSWAWTSASWTSRAA
ncbi:MAG: E3 binding domain-containing protein [Dysosmobacter welbionis]